MSEYYIFFVVAMLSTLLYYAITIPFQIRREYIRLSWNIQNWNFHFCLPLLNNTIHLDIKKDSEVTALMNSVVIFLAIHCATWTSFQLQGILLFYWSVNSSRWLNWFNLCWYLNYITRFSPKLLKESLYC